MPAPPLPAVLAPPLPAVPAPPLPAVLGVPAVPKLLPLVPKLLPDVEVEPEVPRLPAVPGLPLVPVGKVVGCGSSEQAIWTAAANTPSARTWERRMPKAVAKERVFSFTVDSSAALLVITGALRSRDLEKSSSDTEWP